MSKEKYDRNMNLLLITEDENKHYILIENFNTFMYNKTKHKERKHFCMHCLQCISSERVLSDHNDNWVKVKNPILPTRRPTRRSTHHRHTTDTSVDTLPTRRPTHYRHVGRHTTDSWPTHYRRIHRKTYLS